VPPSELGALFEPRGIAVIGASRHADKLGSAMASSLAGFAGDVALVNPRPTPGMHTSIQEAVAATGDIDLSILCVPAPHAAAALRDSANSGVRAALVCAGGFAEVGDAGLEYAAALDEVVAETGIRLLGPNTSGFFVPGAGLCASFVPGARSLRAGQVAVVAASGGMNHVLSFHLADAGVGVSLGVGIGAGQDIDAVDVLRFLVDHEPTRAVIVHIETVADGRALLEAVRELSVHKPVVALVVGEHDVSEFAQSHTGALATSWRTTRAALRQAGAVLVDDEEQAVTAAGVLARTRAAGAAHLRAGLITAQAGPGLLIADRLAGAGIDLPRLADDTVARIAEFLPPMTFQSNPVDTGRPGPQFPDVLAAVAADPSIDALGIYAITEPVVDLVDAVARSGIAGSVPLVLGLDGPADEFEPTRDAAGAAGLAVVRGPSRVAQALAALAEDARGRLAVSAPAEPAPLPVLAGGWGGAWDEARAKDLVDALGVPTMGRAVCADREEARRAAVALGWPLAVKILDATVLHKTEIGGVVLGVSSLDALESALDRVEAAGARAFLLERMAPSGVDLVVGARLDPVFGATVAIGLGGTAVEVWEDVSLRIAPLSTDEAAGMVDDLLGRDLLRGHRGGPTADEHALGALVSALGDVVAAGVVAEIEINPLRVTESGIVALDAVVLPAVETESL